MAALILLLAAPLPALGDSEKVTICHAAGQEGTDQFITLELAYPAVYGPGGHFNEDGTPQAGHEADYLGPCVVESTTTTEAPTTTLEESTTTTTEASTTTEAPTSTIGGTAVTSTLPFTGVDTDSMAGIALSLMAAGTAAVVFGRSRADEPVL